MSPPFTKAAAASPATKVLSLAMTVLYSYFVYLTYISPEVVWESHRERPFDPVWSYAIKAKGAAIAGLLAGLLFSFTQPISHRFSTYLSCFIFHFLALIHHGWCFLKEPEEFFVDSAMHFQYVVIHSVGCFSFGYFMKEAATTYDVGDKQIKRV